jgi:hypothetical protein
MWVGRGLLGKAVAFGFQDGVGWTLSTSTKNENPNSATKLTEAQARCSKEMEVYNHRSFKLTPLPSHQLLTLWLVKSYKKNGDNLGIAVIRKQALGERK